MRIILKCYALTLAVFMGINAFTVQDCYAGCPTSDAQGTRLISIDSPVSLSITSDVADGSTIWRSDWFSSETSLPLCNTTKTVMLSVVNSLIPDEDSALHAYRTGIRGLVIKVYYRDRTQGIHEHALTQDESRKTHVTASSSRIKIQPEFRIEIIKVHHIEMGTNTTIGGMITLKVDDMPVTNIVIHSMGLNVRTPGCDVLTDNVVVNLGEHDQKEFKGTGTFTPYTNLAVTLRCERNVRVNYAVRGSGVDNSANGVISLDKDQGSAQGIGVQIADEYSHPVKLNQYGLWKENNAGGLVEIRFRARYVQTDSIVTAGKANATATVSFIYR